MADLFRQESTREMKARTQMHENVFFNNKIKQSSTTTSLKGKNRQAGNCCAVNITHTRKTTDQHKTADFRRINRETNKGDTGGATETMIN